MSNLLNHSDVLKKARVEMDNQIWQEKLMDELDIFELRYLESIIFETFRLYPTSPLLVTQMSFDVCTIGGYDIMPHKLLKSHNFTPHFIYF